MNNVELIKKCIEKWEIAANCDDSVELKRIKFGRSECPLCVVYNKGGHDGLSCEGCQIFMLTSNRYCGNTPCSDVMPIHDEFTCNRYMDKFDKYCSEEDCFNLIIEYCKQEVVFLNVVLEYEEGKISRNEALDKIEDILEYCENI